ncbi:MAG: HAMP domain-containing sensor histidine kinase [Armatimonadota bacterium]|nr:HAMP domain-containing sensor histidine kinase [Armatimonadota bacterium]MDR7485502.1 HAMP domain-containing sensor histidine kinase [Armatimonadota bacterium]MDR7533047.1 HAMP domain-containing sensor histidine kinase [Armatimonadota bacterium]MDR7536781.1 HAMP domain-containing sensor histidine kinase [Armatimonadota bacterium]
MTRFPDDAAGVRWLIRVRWLAAAAVALAAAALPAAAARAGVPLAGRTGPIAALAVAIAAYNAVFWLRWRRRRAVTRADTHPTVVAQIALDLVALSALLHASGTVENPLIVAYVFHVVIAATLLSPRAAFLTAGAGLLLAGSLSLAEMTDLLPHRPLVRLLPSDLYRRPAYVGNILLSLLVLLATTAYITATIARRLADRERALAAATDLLAASERRKSQYVLMLAHTVDTALGDARQALAVVDGQMRGEVSERARAMLARVQTWLAGLETFVRDVLDLSSLRAAGDLPRSHVYVPRVLYEAVSDLRDVAAERGCVLDVQVPARVPPVFANGPALLQALRNLLRNAVVFGRPGGRVVARIEVDADRLRVVVADDGPGIAPEDLPFIFDEFYRAERTRHLVPGRGLGLAIVKYVAEIHGGDVTVSTRVGEGSTFTLTLPVAPAEAAGSAAAASP